MSIKTCNFSQIQSGLSPPQTEQHNLGVLAQIAKLTKPGDEDEVLRLIKRGDDLDIANVDGLTAFHQACINDNLDMVSSWSRDWTSIFSQNQGPQFF